MEKERCTYVDWYLGKFRLSESNADFVEGIEVKEVSFNTLAPEVQEEISKKQEELFDKDHTELLEKWKSIFRNHFENTRDQMNLIKREIAQAYSLLNHPVPKTQNIRLHSWDLIIDRGLMGEAQNYYKRVILNGETQNTNYICSPNDPHRPDEQDPFSFAEAIYNYYLWLKGNPNTEAANWDNHVFDSIESQGLFFDFCTNVSIDELAFADLCFIFHKMYPKKILLQQTQKSFIEYVNEKLDLNFSQTELPFRNQKRNVVPYKKALISNGFKTEG